jgi:hypothetical protein
MPEHAKAGTEEPRDLEAIDDLYKRWCKAWLSFPDTSLMLTLFDKEFDGVIYQAEENPGGLTSYKDVEAYWHNASALLEKVTDWTEMTKSVSMLTPNVAIVWAELMTGLKTTILPKVVVGKVRCSIGMRKGNSGWKIVHYHESRQLLAEQDAAGNWGFKVDLSLK